MKADENEDGMKEDNDYRYVGVSSNHRHDDDKKLAVPERIMRVPLGCCTYVHTIKAYDE